MKRLLFFLILVLNFFSILFLQGNSIFLYGPEINKYDMKYFLQMYRTLVEKSLEKREFVDFWPKGIDEYTFCTSKEIKNIYRLVETNDQYKILKNIFQTIRLEDGQKIDLIAVGKGVEVLRRILDLHDSKNVIGKVIVIGNEFLNCFRINRINAEQNEYFGRDIVLANEILGNRDQEYDGDLTEDSVESSAQISQKIDEEIVQPQPYYNLDKIIIVIGSEEIGSILEKLKPEREYCCFRKVTISKISLALGVASLVVAILAL